MCNPYSASVGGKQIFYGEQTVFTIQTGKNAKAPYKPAKTFSGYRGSAEAAIRAFHATSEKRRLLMDGEVILTARAT